MINSVFWAIALEVLFWFAVVAIFLFPLLYATLAPWWKTDVGRHEMALSIALLSLALGGILRRVFEHYPGELLLRATSILLTAIVVWWRIIIFLRAQVMGRNQRRKERRT